MRDTRPAAGVLLRLLASEAAGHGQLSLLVVVVFLFFARTKEGGFPLFLLVNDCKG